MELVLVQKSFYSSSKKWSKLFCWSNDLIHREEQSLFLLFHKNSKSKWSIFNLFRVEGTLWTVRLWKCMPWTWSTPLSMAILQLSSRYCFLYFTVLWQEESLWLVSFCLHCFFICWRRVVTKTHPSIKRRRTTWWKCEKSLELSDLHISLFLRFSLLYSHAEMLGYIAYPNGWRAEKNESEENTMNGIKQWCLTQ